METEGLFLKIKHWLDKHPIRGKMEVPMLPVYQYMDLLRTLGFIPTTQSFEGSSFQQIFHPIGDIFVNGTLYLNGNVYSGVFYLETH